MGQSVALGRACGLCGEQVTLAVETDGGTYTDDLTALLETKIDDTVVVKAHCGCSRPRTVALKGTTFPTEAPE